MDRNRAKELLPVIQAFAEGKAVQTADKGKDNWRTAGRPQWLDGHEYRIKTEPREIYVVKGPTGAFFSTVFVTRDGAECSARITKGHGELSVVKFREVIEE